jgi:hypothetical protein
VPRANRMNRRIVCFFVAVLAIVVTGAAHAAEGRREAKAHADRALREYNLGSFEEAISEFGKAYEIEPSPILLFNIGLAHRHLEHFDRATFFFRRYLNETGPDAPSRADAQRYIQEMEAKTAAANKGTEPAPAAVPTTGGTSATPTPTPANGGPSAATPPQPVTGSPSVAPTTPQAGTPTTPAPNPPASQNTPWLRTAAWISGGVAVAALGAGIGFQLASSSNLSDFNSGCGVLNGSIMPTGTDTQAQCVSFHDSWSSDKNWAIAGYAVGGAFAVTSAVLFLTSRPKSTGAEGTVSFSCIPGPAGVACGGLF